MGRLHARSEVSNCVHFCHKSIVARFFVCNHYSGSARRVCEGVCAVHHRFSHAMVYPCTVPLVMLLNACNGCLLAFLREMRGSRGEHEPTEDEMLRASRVLRVQRLLALHDSDNSSDSSSVLATSDVELLMVSNARAGGSPSPHNSEDLADEVNEAGITTQRQRLRGDTAIREARERMGNIYKGA
jgi:hypothetical protein